ncbi:nucleotide exchange factor GrpE [Salinigranum halophilum]|jgi:molecular chaperone GrpE|uniref:nucleotide exchange factor GrpE n=1 Tax=Salinigranum halophilum TaxID=2565931 RepID=UPI0010A76C99|nr:nucleotide exchange factor GrpE [Salinigranum halophilum]
MSDDADMDADAAAEDVESGPAVNGETAAPDDESTGDDADAATGEASTETGLASEVAEVDETLAEDVAALEGRVAELEAALDDARSKLTRKQADFQNYKKRTKKKQEQIKARATEDLVERLVPVRDNLVRALDQDEEADIRPGIESTLTELDRVLEGENVTVIEPQPGDEVDPHRHEVMLRVDAEQPAGTVVDLYQPGYEMAEKVIRPAQVTVSSGADTAE